MGAIVTVFHEEARLHNFERVLLGKKRKGLSIGQIVNPTCQIENLE